MMVWAVNVILATVQVCVLVGPVEAKVQVLVADTGPVAPPLNAEAGVNVTLDPV